MFFLRNAKDYTCFCSKDPQLSTSINYIYMSYHLSFVPILPRSLTNSAPQPVLTCKSTNSSWEAKVKVKANQNDPRETWLQEGMFVAWCLLLAEYVYNLTVDHIHVNIVDLLCRCKSCCILLHVL